MYKGYRYVDSDAHVLEPPEMWQRYLEPEFRPHAPHHTLKYEGDPPVFHFEVTVGESVMPVLDPTHRTPPMPSLAEAYADSDPQAVAFEHGDHQSCIAFGRVFQSHRGAIPRHAAEGSTLDASDLQVGLEAVHLATEGVSTDIDVH